MTSLFTLDLSQNQLTSTLKLQNISSSQLNYLDLMINKLYGSIPRSTTNFTYLQYLYFSSINPKDMLELNLFFELKCIESLFLSSYNLLISKGKINSTLPKFRNLRFCSCNLLEFPIFLKSLNELQYLDLSNNKLKAKYLNGSGMLERRHCNL